MNATNSNARGTRLRRRAERRLERVQALKRSVKSKANIERLLHELEVYRMGLHLQNESLREAHAKAKAAYEELYDFAPVGYFTLGRDGAVHKANLTGARALACARDGLIGRRFISFVARDSRDKFAAFLARVFRAEGKESCTVELAATSECAFPAVAYIEASAERGDRECRAVLVDMTSTVQAQTALGESQARLKLALAAARIGAWEWDGRTRQVYWSSECCEMFGIGQVCMPLESLAKHVHAADKVRIAMAIERVLRHNTVQSAEFRVMRPDGKVIWVYAVGRAVYDLAGKTHRILGIAHDVTERKFAAATIRSEQDALMRRVQERVGASIADITATRRPARGAKRQAHDRLLWLERAMRPIELLHEMLYASENAAQVDCAVYLTRLLERMGLPVEAAVENSSQPMMVDVRDALCCALLLNELMGNNARPVIAASRVRVARPAAQMLRVGVERDSAAHAVIVTIDRGHVLKRASANFAMLRTLAHQLGATIDAGREGGLCFKFPRNGAPSGARTARRTTLLEKRPHRYASAGA